MQVDGQEGDEGCVQVQFHGVLLSACGNRLFVIYLTCVAEKNSLSGTAGGDAINYTFIMGHRHKKVNINLGFILAYILQFCFV